MSRCSSCGRGGSAHVVGRLAELATCEEVLSADSGGSAAVVIVGPAGIGKTTVWRAVTASRPGGGLVLATTGVPCAQAAFANLADLLDPVTSAVLPQLPGPQAAALRMAVGMEDMPTPFPEALLERAVIEVLRLLAPAGVLVAIDDEQWIDPDTRRLLEAAAVRLAEVPARWLMTVRPGYADRGLARVLDHELAKRAVRIELGDLDEATLSELIINRFPRTWSPGVLRRVVALAAGNPYTALELARETAVLGGGDGASAHLPSTLAGVLRSRLARLGPRTLAVVQAAALTAAPTRALLRAVSGESVDEQVEEALEADILQASPPDPVLRFSHPLLEEAAVGMLTGPRRRRLHRAISTVLGDTHEAAWHLACAAEEPDEALAQRVEQAAMYVGTRGALSRAAALARAAVALTPDQASLPAWNRRMMWLGWLAPVGEYDQARRLGEQWAPHVPALLRGRLAFLRAQAEPDAEASYRLLAQAFGELTGRNPAHAAQVGAQIALILGFMLGQLDQARPYAAAAIGYARTASDPAVLRQALAGEGLLKVLAGDPCAAAQLQAAMQLSELAQRPLPYYSPETALALWHIWRGEPGPARDFMKAVLTAAQEHGAEECAYSARLVLAGVEWWAGNWDTAAGYAAATAQWSLESSRAKEGSLAYITSLIEAGRGNITRAREQAISGLQAAEAQRNRTFTVLCRWVLGHIELSADAPAAALRWLEPIAETMQHSGIREPGCYPFTADLIETWAATGHLDRAASRLTWLQDAARRLDHPWARITSGRAAAVLRLARGDPAGAVQTAAAVIPEARRLQLPLELGRCLLVLGTAQRKARKRRDAAQSLDEAAAVFRRLGATQWQALATAQRARLAPSPHRALTPTERRIAELAASGHSNPEIAAALYISVKTVEANLTRVYRKLGVRRRVDLAHHRFQQTRAGLRPPHDIQV